MSDDALLIWFAIIALIGLLFMISLTLGWIGVGGVLALGTGLIYLAFNFNPPARRQ